MAARRAGQQKLPVLGFFCAGGDRGPWARIAAVFREALQEGGFVDGRNVHIDYVWADDQYDQLPALAADLVQRRVDLIVASPRAVDAAKAATGTIPIVFLAGADPVRIGLVPSLGHPGANLTGVTLLAGDLNAKRFELFRNLVLEADTIGISPTRRTPARQRSNFILRR